MSFKEFFLFNKQKLVLLLFLAFFAPLPFFILFAGGFAPPASILVYFLSPEGNTVLSLVSMVAWLIATLFAYLISCFMLWIIRKITTEKRTQWIIVVVFGLLLTMISFFTPLYYIGDIGGGEHKMSSYDMCVQTYGLFVKFLPKVLGCEFAKSGLKDSCYRDKAIKIKEASLCGKIQKEQMEINCYDALAKIKNDPRICDLIERSINRWGCVANIAQSNNDEKICEYLRPSDDIKSCLSQVRSRH
jgi:hypothetical protein